MNTKKSISLSVLEKITNGFSVHSRIGIGGYGNVYKGVYNGKEIAVKLLNVDTSQGLDDKKFKNEVGNLLRAEHSNIVQLVGYCYEIKKLYVDRSGASDFSAHIYRVICFEYLQGGSLDKYIYEKSFAPNWSTRYYIIKGICEGLNFLHGLEPPILHLDLKPANILLDNFMVPKVADFGLSRVSNLSQTNVTENRIGTWKYMPPEFITKGEISTKNDIFSVGVVIIEIMTGSSSYSDYTEIDIAQLTQRVVNNWSTMIEATSKYRSEKLYQVKTCIGLAIQCVDSERDNRPTIAEILDALNKTETNIPEKQAKLILPAEEHTHVTPMQKNVPSLHEIIEHRETSSKIEVQVVGRENEKQEIMDILFILSNISTQEITFLQIYGIGGIGKTTVAQLVFNDSQFKEYSRVWIYVSQTFDLKKIGNSIITQLSRSEINHTDSKQLRESSLEKVLAGKRVLIILDDVWESPQLRKLASMLNPGEGGKVVVVVTTREESIAQKIHKDTVKYKLAPLTDEICWTIIKNKSSFETRAERAQLELIGKAIAKKCGGLALAAQSIGYTLDGMNFDEWVSVNNSEIWEVLALEEYPPDHVHASLKLSYHMMKKYLQLCFSYCATFPKGHNIANEDLAHQWIALGLVEPSWTFPNKLTSLKYISQLLGMSFLERSRSQLTMDDNNKFLIMHDLVHDLARSVLGDEINIESPACRYAWLTDHRKLFKSSMNPLGKIRALHFVDRGHLQLCGDLFSAAKCLLVLDLSRCCTQELPDSIGHLKQLRYLDASWNLDYTKPSELQSPPKTILIPEALGSLNELQYLNLSHRGRLIGLPEVIYKLTELRYLNLSHCEGFYLIDRPSANQSCIDCIGALPNLEQLDLSRNDYVFSVPESFSSLKELNLNGCDHIVSLPENVAKVDNSKLFGLLKVFNVTVVDSESSSSLVWLKNTNPDLLRICDLQNVKSVEEARSIRLMGKNRIEKLSLMWGESMRSVEDMELLTHLVPPSSVKDFLISCYQGVILPHWCMSISQYLPNLVIFEIWGSSCSSPPTLVQLPNLRKIVLAHMPNLEEFDTACSMGENELTLAKLEYLRIYCCPKLRIKPCPPRAVLWDIVRSDNVLSSWGDSASSRASSSSYSPVSKLKIEHSELPLYQWRLLHHLPGLSDLTIGYCYDLTISAQITQAFSSLKSLSLGIHGLKKLPEWLGKLTSLRHLNLERYYGLEEFHENMRQLTQLQSLSLENCKKLTALPQWLGELPLLKTLKIDDCQGIISLPESILSNVQELRILNCPKLYEWLHLEENQTKLAHIKENKVLPRSAKAHEETIDLINMNAFVNLAASTHGTMTDEMHPDLYTAVMNVPGIPEQQVSWLMNFCAKALLNFNCCFSVVMEHFVFCCSNEDKTHYTTPHSTAPFKCASSIHGSIVLDTTSNLDTASGSWINSNIEETLDLINLKDFVDSSAASIHDAVLETTSNLDTPSGSWINSNIEETLDLTNMKGSVSSAASIHGTVLETTSNLDPPHPVNSNIEETIDFTNMKFVGDSSAASILGTVTDEMHADMYSAVMNVPGFPEEALLVALSHLMDNDAQGSAYMGMHKEQRVSWLIKFLKRHY